MSQHDYVLDNAIGSNFRADANAALAASVTLNSGATEPTTTYAYMWWADTTTGLLKRRNSTNASWVTIMSLDSLTFASPTMTGTTQVAALTASALATLNGGAYVVGNVGIGVASPSGPLDIQAQTTGALALKIRGRASGDFGYIQFTNNAGTASSYIGSTGSALYVETNGVERLRWHNSGGISAFSATDPGAGVFAVTGNISATSGAGPQLTLIDGGAFGTNATPSLRITDGAGTTGAYIGYLVDGSGALSIYNNVAAGTDAGNIFIRPDGAAVIGDFSSAGLAVTGITSSTSGFKAPSGEGITLSDDGAGGFLAYGYSGSRANAAEHRWYNGRTTLLATLGATGLIVNGTAATQQRALYGSGTTTAASFAQFSNTSGNAYFGVEGATPGAINAGASAYDTCINAHTSRGISFSCDNGASNHARISSTGFAVIGAISAGGTTNDGSTLAQFTQSGTGRAGGFNRSVATATRPVVTVSQGSATGGTQAALLIQQADTGEVALGINTDGSLTAFNFSVTDTGAVTSASSILSSHATAGIGYTTGAGGTVTQATSKSTGVTLNKVSGRITMNNASLAAGASVAFTLTNSAIAATDTLGMTIRGATATANTYVLSALVAAGSATIEVYNKSVSSAAEAIDIQFNVIKGVVA